MDEVEAWTQMGPGPELLRLEEYKDFVPKPFLGFGPVVPKVFYHLVLRMEGEGEYYAKCGAKITNPWDKSLPKCPICYKEE